VVDSLFNGHRFRALTIVDNFSRESLAIEAGQSLTGAEVAEIARRATRSAFMHSVESHCDVVLRQVDLLFALSCTQARSADWFAAADAGFCKGHHQASQDWLAAAAFNAPNSRRRIWDALEAVATEEAAGWLLSDQPLTIKHPSARRSLGES